jgi:hypothetical protein
MVGKTFKVVLCLSVLTLACGTLFAQSHQPLIAHTDTPSRVVTPAQAPPTGLKKIFSNLGPTTADYYNDTTGYYLLGPTNSVGDPEQWIAVPFIAKQDSHVAELQVAVGGISGTRKVFIGLYSDNAGSVGTELVSGAAYEIPNFGVCCHLVIVNVPPTAVTEGAQYWIGVTTDDVNAPNFTGVVQSSNQGTTAYNPETEEWISFSNNWPAAAAFGTIP